LPDAFGYLASFGAAVNQNRRSFAAAVDPTAAYCLPTCAPIDCAGISSPRATRLSNSADAIAFGVWR
jgi:hypothetical protein